MLQGRVAIVTGGGRGIGRAVAVDLARQGARVVVNDAGVEPDGTGHDSGPAAAACDEIERLGGVAVADDSDVAVWGAAADLIDVAIDSFGRADILVNNAGIVRFQRFERMTEEQWDAVLSVHLKGAFNCCRHAVPHMLTRGHGRIINMISASVQGFPVQANYLAAKAGIIGLTLALAVELGERGITANAFAPSGQTRLLDAMRRGGDDREVEANAPAVTWLASDAAGHVNGQILGWGGGVYQLYEQMLTPTAELRLDHTPTPEDFARAFTPFLQPVGRAVDPRALARLVAHVDGEG